MTRQTDSGVGVRAERAVPLRPAEAAGLADALADVRSAVGAVLEWVPAKSRRATDLARHLGMDRATVHRLIALSHSHGKGLEIVERAPGVEGMRGLIEAADAQGAPQRLTRGLTRAIDEFERVVREIAGSKRSLERRIRATVPVSSAETVAEAERRNRQARREMMLAAAEVLGKRVEVRADVALFRASRERAGWLDCVQARGVFGCRARDGARPMVIDYRNRAPHEGGAGDEPGAGAAITALLEGFSSDPAPLVVSRGVGGRVRHVVDPARTRDGRSVDVAVAHRLPASCRHPGDDEEDRRLEVGALVREPTGALIMDVYVEPAVLRGCTPAAELYVWSPGLDSSLADHWLDRVEPAPTVQLLGQGLGGAATSLHERHAAFTAEVFGRAGWDPAGFVGFRMTADPPQWGGGYFLVFDFDTP